MTGPVAAGTQRRLRFSATSQPLTVHAYINGRTVVLTTTTDRISELAGHLEVIAVGATANETHGYTVPPSRLHRLTGLPDNVTVEPDLELEPVWQLAQLYGRGELDTPAMLTLRSRRLHLGWESFDGDGVDGYLSSDAVATLLHSNLPFTATSDAWDWAARSTHLPITAGSARIDPGGYIRIEAAHPNQIEAAPIPGLWKIDQHHYGAPLPYLDSILRIGGLTWPAGEARPSRPGPLTGQEHIDQHVALGAYELLSRIETCGSSIVTWPSGSGRRLVVLEALVAAEALPTQILCPGWSVWPWQAALDAVGISENQARVIAYDDLEAGGMLHTTPSVVFDEFFHVPGNLAALARLDQVEGVIRVGVTSSWPDSLPERCRAMRLIRPEEFSGESETAMLRYPLWPARRADEHTSAYQIPPPALPTRQTRRRRLTIIRSEATNKQRQLTVELLDRSDLSEADLAGRLTELATAGAVDELSPKIADVIKRANLLPEGGRALVGIDSVRGARLLAAMLKGRTNVDVVTVAALLDGRGEQPGCEADTIVVCSYPQSGADLSRLLKVDRPANIIVAHLSGSFDDELALASASGRPPSVARFRHRRA